MPLVGGGVPAQGDRDRDPGWPLRWAALRADQGVIDRAAARLRHETAQAQYAGLRAPQVAFSRRGAEGPVLANGLVRPRNASDLLSESRAMPADLLPPLEPPDPDDPELEEHLALVSALIKIFELDQETARVTDDGRGRPD